MKLHELNPHSWLGIAVQSIIDGYESAIKKHGPINSAHEGRSVIQEEIEELEQAINDLKVRGNSTFWLSVKGDDFDACMKEAQHVGAMALRFLIDIPNCRAKWKRTDALAFRPDAFVKAMEPIAEIYGYSDISGIVLAEAKRNVESMSEDLEKADRGRESMMATIQAQEKAIESLKATNTKLSDENEHLREKFTVIVNLNGEQVAKHVVELNSCDYCRGKGVRDAGCPRCGKRADDTGRLEYTC